MQIGLSCAMKHANSMFDFVLSFHSFHVCTILSIITGHLRLTEQGHLASVHDVQTEIINFRSRYALYYNYIHVVPSKGISSWFMTLYIRICICVCMHTEQGHLVLVHDSGHGCLACGAGGIALQPFCDAAHVVHVPVQREGGREGERETERERGRERGMLGNEYRYVR